MIFSWIPGGPKQVQVLGQVPEASTIYDLQLDSGGNVWGGTYPTGTVFRYGQQDIKFQVFPRMAEDTDYVRRLAIGPDDRFWAGTVSRNPKMFSFSVARPEDRTEIQLPKPQSESFISSIEVLGKNVVVSASDVTAQMVLDSRSLKWVSELNQVWAARRSSADITSSRRFFCQKGNYTPLTLRAGGTLV